MQQTTPQEPLFVEDVYEALTHACRAIAAAAGHPKGWAKHVGACLWPHKSPDDAGKLLANCLDKTRDQKLDVEQVLWIMREAKRVGCHVLAAYVCDHAEYQRPTPIDPDDAAAELQRQYIASVRFQKQLADRLERLVGGDRDPPMVR